MATSSSCATTRSERDACAAIGYAVVEGVSFGLLDGWRSLASTAEVASLSLVGGGAQSELWAQLLASLLGVPMQLHAHAGAGGALGAARLAWLADGGVEADVCRIADVAREFLPDAVEEACLAPRYERFRSLYAALRGEFETAHAEPA